VFVKQGHSSQFNDVILSYAFLAGFGFVISPSEEVSAPKVRSKNGPSVIYSNKINLNDIVLPTKSYAF